MRERYRTVPREVRLARKRGLISPVQSWPGFPKGRYMSCLKCTLPHRSVGPQNRLCQPCREVNATFAQSCEGRAFDRRTEQRSAPQPTLVEKLGSLSPRRIGIDFRRRD
jgi:hypothetical protein